MTANVPAEDEVEKVEGGIMDLWTLFFVRMGRVARILEREKVKVQSEKMLEKMDGSARLSL